MYVKSSDLDVAALPNATCVKVAGNHGRAVGKTIAEGKGQPFVKVPVFWSAREYFQMHN